MKQLIRECLVDCSDEKEFCFALICVECGNEWKSTPIRFSKAREKGLSEMKRIIVRAMYQREYERAREEAVKEAVEHFNLCPLCQRLVCDYCFLICDDLDLCRVCAKNMQEKGEYVIEKDPKP